MKQVQKAFGISALLLLAVTAMQPSPVFAKNLKDKKLDVRGVISDLSASSITISSRVILVSLNTRIKDFLGAKTDISALKVGDCVKVKLAKKALQDSAKEIELRKQCPAPAASAVDVSPTPSPIPSITPTPEGNEMNDDSGVDSTEGQNHGKTGGESSGGHHRH